MVVLSWMEKLCSYWRSHCCLQRHQELSQGFGSWCWCVPRAQPRAHVCARSWGPVQVCVFVVLPSSDMKILISRRHLLQMWMPTSRTSTKHRQILLSHHEVPFPLHLQTGTCCCSTSLKMLPWWLLSTGKEKRNVTAGGKSVIDPPNEPKPRQTQQLRVGLTHHRWSGCCCWELGDTVVSKTQEGCG